VAKCMVAEQGGEAKNCDQPATHYILSKLGVHSAFIPLCTKHKDEVESSPDVVRAITEARGPR
jgi:hypothetical protein